MPESANLRTVLDMSKLTALPTGTEQHVTASDLVRHFGIWQDRASRAPVYIMHRGRPRLVLTSLDVMDALCAPHTNGSARDEHLDGLLDKVEDIIIVLARDRTIVGASRGARGYFGNAVRLGEPIGGLTPSGDETLIATVARVGASGLSETIECRSPRFPDRLLAYTVDCGPAGCILQVRDATAVEEMQQWRDRHDSAFKAIEAAGGACVIVNLRGRIEQASSGLAALTGASVDALTSARLVSLVAVGDRSALGDAFEAAIDHRASRSLEAAMLVGGAALRRVTIGLAPLSSAGRIIGVTTVATPATS